MRESEAYPELYQESAARKTRDKAINILQGRCVGGGTTVNWTSSFRTPPATLAFWQREFGLAGFTRRRHGAVVRADGGAPVDRAVGRRAQREQRGARARRAKHRHPGGRDPAQRQGLLEPGLLRHGLPDQRQAVDAGHDDSRRAGEGRHARHPRARAATSCIASGRVTQLEGRAMDARGIAPTARSVRVRARAYIAAAGAIGTPALLLRSGAPDPHGILGKRTFLHPTVVSAALMPERVDGFAGAPQTIYSDHFLDTQPIDGPLGYKLEAPPLHPVLTAITLPDDGVAHAHWMRGIPADAGADRAAARRLPSGKPGRHRAPARRRHAGARLSAAARLLGRRAARAALDGGDPVRGRRADGDAGPRRRRGLHELRRRAGRDRRLRACSRWSRRSSPRT